MSKDGFLTIAEWMLDLDLNTTEMLAFALICGINMHAHSDYHGSVAHLARWCRVSERQARSILRKLVETGYLNVEKYPGKVDHYTVREEIISGVKKLPGREEIISGVRAEKISYDNIVRDNIEDKINIPPISTARAKDDKILYGENVRLTADEHAKLVTRFGADDTARLVEILDGYLSNPKQRNRYANHYRAILGWPVQRLTEEKLTQQRLQNSQEAAQRVNAQQKQPGPPPGNYAALADANRRFKEITDKYKN